MNKKWLEQDIQVVYFDFALAVKLLRLLIFFLILKIIYLQSSFERGMFITSVRLD
jgi:hypothetical protein